MEGFVKACGQVRAVARLDLLSLITAGSRGDEEALKGLADKLLRLTEESE